MSLAPRFSRADPTHETTAGQAQAAAEEVGGSALPDEAPWWLLLARLHL
jgi:hypothetical protein